MNTRKNFYTFWIGLNDKKHENDWYWIDGKKAIKSETNWYNGGNNAGNKEDCAELINTVFEFNDLDCTRKIIAWCEID